jgi:hypothetical protein
MDPTDRTSHAPQKPTVRVVSSQLRKTERSASRTRIHVDTRSPNKRPLVKSLDKRLDKLDKFQVLQSTSQLECKPMRERGIPWA